MLPPLPLPPTTVRALHIYREKTSALSPFVDSSRILPSVAWVAPNAETESTLSIDLANAKSFDTGRSVRLEPGLTKALLYDTSRHKRTRPTTAHVSRLSLHSTRGTDIVFAIRRCAAWASTVILINTPRKKNKINHSCWQRFYPRLSIFHPTVFLYAGKPKISTGRPSKYRSGLLTVPLQRDVLGGKI